MKSKRRADGRAARVLRVLMDFRQVVAAAKRHFQGVQEKLGLSGAQLWALWQVENQAGLKVSELAQKMSIHQTTASNLIEKLESSGYLRRRRSADDHRVVCLHATAAGQRVLARAPAPTRGVLPDAIDRLSEQELDTLEMALAALLREIGGRGKAAAKRPLSDLLG
jgi:DNA-binding MarR family transcriptional regulator